MMGKPGPSKMVAGRATIIAASRVGRQRVRQKLGALKSFRVQTRSERRYAIAYARVPDRPVAWDWGPVAMAWDLRPC